ncbi:MAG: F0F1 ATP synthase subunit B [Parvularculaceae bacterium]|nr:F0F1 ATP synthase subunit B [Parvularculaceae bacterium]
MIPLVPLAAAALAAEETDKAPAGLLGDASFFVLAAFLLVIAVFWRMGAHKAIAGGLDKRAQKIADELDQARKLREEAQELLAQYQRRQRAAEEEAKGVIEQARRDAAALAAEQRKKINEQIARRAKAAEEKIARAEAQALAEVRGQTADMAIEIARRIIRERMDQGAQTALVDRAISEVRAKLN